MDSSNRKFKVAIVGAGISGFSCATCIQENIPECDVTVIAEDVMPDITSEAAAGLIELHCVGDTPMELLQKWLKTTLERVIHIYYTHKDAKTSGIHTSTGYFLSKTEHVEDLVSKDALNSLPHWHRLSPNEMSCFPKHKSGLFVSSMTAESALYVQWMMKQFFRNKGKLIKKRVFNFKELVHDFHAVINCSGLGARELANDETLTPIKGWVLKVNAPWVKQFLFDADYGDTYIIPGTNTVTLGGIHQTGNWNRNMVIDESKGIRERCCELLPSLSEAKIIREVGGLRPFRPKGVRLEEVEIISEGKSIPCIHNYGHGGAGVSLSWGCAVDVTGYLKNYMIKIENNLADFKSHL